jgi:hypothetical protein
MPVYPIQPLTVRIERLEFLIRAKPGLAWHRLFYEVHVGTIDLDTVWLKTTEMLADGDEIQQPRVSAILRSQLRAHFLGYGASSLYLCELRDLTG